MDEIVAWLNEQIAKEQKRAFAALADDEGFYEGMVDAYKLTLRQIEAMRDFGGTRA